jgi:hypothetical protein
MVSSRAQSVAAYLAELPAERRKVIAAVRKLVRANIPKGYREVMNWGMIAWEIPLSKYPDTYNGQPLLYVSLAAQKNNYALYMTGGYQAAERHRKLKEAYKAAGKKLDMGKSCLRFKSLDDLVPGALGAAIASTPVAAYIATYEASRKK